MKPPVVLSTLVAMFLLGACSGSTGGAVSCSDATGCGGNVVGTWKATCSSLAVVGQPSSGCFTTNASGFEVVAGTFMATSTMTYTLSLTTMGTVHVDIPPSCLNSGTCDQLSQQEQMNFPGSSCAPPVGGGCRCSVPINSSQNESGTYAIQGNNIVLTPNSGAPYTASYCASGSQLTVGVRSTSVGLTTVGTISFAMQ